jgi:putative Holliday junction resolvase
LGLDVGDKRVGLALSDPLGLLASPLTIITRQDDKSAIEAIIELVNRHQVERIIVGLPRSLDGRFSKQAEKVTAFTQCLTERTEVPVEFRDERLSTVSARRLMQDARKKRTIPDDAFAAAVVLQAYLDESSLLRFDT